MVEERALENRPSQGEGASTESSSSAWLHELFRDYCNQYKQATPEERQQMHNSVKDIPREMSATISAGDQPAFDGARGAWLKGLVQGWCSDYDKASPQERERMLDSVKNMPKELSFSFPLDSAPQENRVVAATLGPVSETYRAMRGWPSVTENNVIAAPLGAVSETYRAMRGWTPAENNVIAAPLGPVSETYRAMRSWLPYAENKVIAAPLGPVKETYRTLYNWSER